MGNAKKERTKEWCKSNHQTQMNSLDQMMIQPLACEQCGACCKKSILELLPEDIIREPRLKEFMRSRSEIPENIPLAWSDKCDYIIDIGQKKESQFKICPFLKNNRCSIHETKPEVCRLVYPSILTCKMFKLNMDPVRFAETFPNSTDLIRAVLSTHPERANEVFAMSMEERAEFAKKVGTSYAFYNEEERKTEGIKMCYRLAKNNISLN